MADKGSSGLSLSVVTIERRQRTIQSHSLDPRRRNGSYISRGRLWRYLLGVLDLGEGSQGT